jgi:hypothetical protein
MSRNAGLAARCQFGLKPAVGMSEFVVASPGRPLPCAGQDLDHCSVPVHRVFHGERLTEERLTFTEPTFVGDHRFVCLHVRSKFRAYELHR